MSKIIEAVLEYQKPEVKKMIDELANRNATTFAEFTEKDPIGIKCEGILEVKHAYNMGFTAGADAAINMIQGFQNERRTRL